MEKGEMATLLDRETLDRIIAEANGFVENYYRTFDANRADLVNLYREELVLNFEGRERIKGEEAIVAKLTSLQQCQYHISKINCSPQIRTRGALVLATGFMWQDGKQEALRFSQEDGALDEMGIFVRLNITTTLGLGDPFVHC